MFPILLFLAALLPPDIDDWKRKGATGSPAPQQLPVAREYGLLEAESAEYERGAKTFRLDVYRLKDATGAYAWAQALDAPGEAKRIFRYRNYVFEAKDGVAPRAALEAFLFPALPKLDREAVPTLGQYLPGQNKRRGTERYVLGPVSLRAFAPRIPAGAAGFDFAGELQVAEYETPMGVAWMGVFQFPNQLIAREQKKALEGALRGVEAVAMKREGPLLIVAMAKEAGAAIPLASLEGLTAPVTYRAEVMMDMKPEKPIGNPGDMLVAIFQLLGLILVVTLGLGIFFAFGMQFLRRDKPNQSNDEFTSLKI
ncbi:MAG: hypothetical protein OHK0021_06470 [Bryobacter sp.]